MSDPFRTNPIAVKNILDNCQLTDAVILGYIADANALINQALSSSGLSAALLASIEKWLTAHMIVSTVERVAQSEEAGGAKIRYTGAWGAGLSSTSYGQQVLALDTTGAIAALGKKSASITAIATEDW